MADSLPPAEGPDCLNCGARGAGAYCADCGQSSRTPRRDLGALLAELFGSLFSFDGRVWKSMVPLFFRPGALTRAWMEGRRAAFVPPLRLFLFFSILLFLLVQLRAGSSDLLLDEDGSGGVVKIARTPVEGAAPGEERAEFDFPLPGFWPFTAIRARLEEQESRFNRLSQQEQAYLLSKRALELAPLALLLLLPLMAVFLKLWWLRTGTFYLDHLVLLLHAYAFLCGLMVLLALLPLPSWAPRLVCGLGVPFYFHRAMRRAYQRGFWRTLGATGLGAVVTLFAALLVSFLLIPYGLLTV